MIPAKATNSRIISDGLRGTSILGLEAGFTLFNPMAPYQPLDDLPDFMLAAMYPVAKPINKMITIKSIRGMDIVQNNRRIGTG
jgi:hypothetical protein